MVQWEQLCFIGVDGTDDLVNPQRVAVLLKGRILALQLASFGCVSAGGKEAGKEEVDDIGASGPEDSNDSNGKFHCRKKYKERVNRDWERINRTGGGGGSGESLVYKERTGARQDMTWPDQTRNLLLIIWKTSLHLIPYLDGEELSTESPKIVSAPVG